MNNPVGNAPTLLSIATLSYLLAIPTILLVVALDETKGVCSRLCANAIWCAVFSPAVGHLLTNLSASSRFAQDAT